VSDTVTRRLMVSGRVQGVCFRDWTLSQARALGLAGWVRNRRDGRVEILAKGGEAALAELAARCRRGPPAANVEAVEVSEGDEPAGPGFDRRPTA